MTTVPPAPPATVPELPADWRFFLDTALEAARSAAPIQRKHFCQEGLNVESKADESPVTIADRGSEERMREVFREHTPDFGIYGEEFGAEGNAVDRWIIDPIDGTKNYVAGVPYYATLIGLMLDGLLVMGVVHAPSLPVDPGLGTPQRPEDHGRTWWGILGHGSFTGYGTRVDTASRQALRVTQTDDLSRAFVCHGGLAHFRRHRWEPFVELIDRCGRTRGFGDWWGHMLVAEGKCDAMVEPIVALHDLAAIKPIVEEAGGRFSVPDGELLVESFASGTISSNAHLHAELREVLRFKSTERASP